MKGRGTGDERGSCEKGGAREERSNKKNKGERKRKKKEGEERERKKGKRKGVPSQTACAERAAEPPFLFFSCGARASHRSAAGRAGLLGVEFASLLCCESVSIFNLLPWVGLTEICFLRNPIA